MSYASASTFDGPTSAQLKLYGVIKWAVIFGLVGCIWVSASRIRHWLNEQTERRALVANLDQAEAAAIYHECADLLFRRYPDRATSADGWEVPPAAFGPAIRELKPALVELWPQEVTITFARGFNEPMALTYVADLSYPNRSADELRRQLGSDEKVIYSGGMHPGF